VIAFLVSMAVSSLSLGLGCLCLVLSFRFVDNVSAKVQSVLWVALSLGTAGLFAIGQIGSHYQVFHVAPVFEALVLRMFGVFRIGDQLYHQAGGFAAILPNTNVVAQSLFAMWAIVAAVLIVIRCYQIFLAQQFSIWAEDLDDERILNEASALENSLRITRSPKIRESFLVKSPLVVGVLRFTLLMPSGMSRKLSNHELKAILAHEYSHIVRRDTRMMVLLIAIECFYWFNPAIWFAHRQWATCREIEADSEALNYSKIEPRQFANLLLSIVTSNRQPWLQTAIGATRDFKTLKKRLMKMKPTQKNQSRYSLVSISMLAAASILLIFPWQISLAHPVDPQGDNLLINGDFENALTNWEPSSIPQGSETNVRFGVDSSEKHSGKSSLKFSKTVQKFFPVQQLVGTLKSSYKVTRRLETTAWVKASNAGKMTLKSVFFDSRGESIDGGWITYVGDPSGSRTVSHDWKKYKSVVEVPSGTEQIAVVAEMYGPGEVWIDDISVKFVDNATPLISPTGASSKEEVDPSADVKDVPNVELQAKKDPNKDYFLIGNKGPATGAGYKLLLVMPGGDGSKDFNPFIRRIWKNAELDKQGFVIAQLVAPKWENSENRIVWPIRSSTVGAAKFKTEEFVNDVIADVKSKIKIDPEHIYAFGWSSGGPATYAALLDSPSLKGVFVAMSIFRQNDYPTLNLAKGRSVYLFQSPDDKVTVFSWAEKARDAFKAVGVRTELVSYPGGHGFTSGRPYEDIKAALDWLTRR
jgi:beta-lactamase regulating signal transducer with metallopeptidase domain/predicted esterase